MRERIYRLGQHSNEVPFGQIIFNPQRFELVRRQELNDLNDGNNRSPLVAQLKDKWSHREFVVAVHLARGNEVVRRMQAQGLVAWAGKQTLPVIVIGDFNFDFDFHNQTGNESFKAFRRDGIWKWVKPTEMIDTNWADNDKDGTDDYPDSMLGFAFVAGFAKDWTTTCEVLVRQGDFPDNDKTSDDRPVRLVVSPTR